jgi:hypothetical protein
MQFGQSLTFQKNISENITSILQGQTVGQARNQVFIASALRENFKSNKVTLIIKELNLTF